MMMMERPKEEGKGIEETHSLNKEENLKSQIRNSDDAIVDLEQRLNRLGRTTSTTRENNENSSLLNRIQLAQQRAREAQRLHREKLEKEKEMSARMKEEVEKSSEVPAGLKNEDEVLPPPSFEAIPPPPFEAFEEQEEIGKEEDIPPPPFELVEEELGIIAPSAPDDTEVFAPLEENKEDTSVLDFLAIYPHAMPETQQKASSTEDTEELKKIIYEDQIRILDQIQASKQQEQQQTTAVGASSNEMVTETMTAVPAPPPSRTIQLGPDHFVPLHGPEKTRSAIEQGTAILTQCCNCSSYLQVTSTATLMYCPCCQTVSPVEATSSCKSREEVLQENNDRKLAQKMQDEEYAQNREGTESSTSNFWGMNVFGKHRGQQQEQGQSQQQQTQGTWSEYFSSFIYSAGEEESAPLQTSNNNTSTPLYSVETGTEENTNFSQQYSPATVAERKPMYSCIVDGANTVAETVSRGWSQSETENMYNGIDTTALLADEENHEEV